MTTIAISTTEPDGGEYSRAVVDAGGAPRLLAFDAERIDAQLAACGGVLLSGGGDVDPRQYGAINTHAHEIADERDAFELALVRRARALGIPTLCICRGLQVANVAFGGTLVQDIAAARDVPTAALHRREANGKAERGLLDGHDVAIEPNSLLARVVGRPAIVTGSRHHQSLDRIAPDLRVVARTPDGIVEAAEARFPSPFWLGVQWHPESTTRDDGGISATIFAAFVAAASRVRD